LEECSLNNDEFKSLIIFFQDFEVIYRYDFRSFLIPALLSNHFDETKEIELNKLLNSEKNTLEIEYIFKFLPTELFTRLIIRLNKCTKIMSVCKKGIYLNNKNDNAFLEVIQFQQFKIKVNGIYPQNLMSIITNVLDTLLKDFYNLEYEIDIICPNCILLQVDDKGKFSKKLIEESKEKKETNLFCKKCLKKSFLENLIDNDIRYGILQNVLYFKDHNEKIDTSRVEFIHRQFMALLHSQYHQSVPLIIPVFREGNAIKCYNLCQHIGHWHFVNDVYYDLSEEKRLEVVKGKGFVYFQSTLKLLIEIFAITGPPNNLPNEKGWDQINKELIYFSNYQSDMIFKNKEDSKNYFDIIISDPNVKKLNEINIPTSDQKIFICDKHKNENQSNILGKEFELNQNSIQIVKFIGRGNH
jgi:hypothetical protein